MFELYLFRHFYILFNQTLIQENENLKFVTQYFKHLSGKCAWFLGKTRNLLRKCFSSNIWICHSECYCYTCSSSCSYDFGASRGHNFGIMYLAHLKCELDHSRLIKKRTNWSGFVSILFTYINILKILIHLPGANWKWSLSFMRYTLSLSQTDSRLRTLHVNVLPLFNIFYIFTLEHNILDEGKKDDSSCVNDVLANWYPSANNKIIFSTFLTQES